MSNIKIPWEGWELAKDKPIGKGGFGEVYEIRRNMYGLEEKAAMKILTIPKDESDLEALRFEGLDDDSIARTYHGYVSNMVKEYETMQKLRNNPHVVHVDDLQVNKDTDELLWTVYIRMELLMPITKNPSCVKSEKQILQLAKDICSALIACHKRNILHRDIKPENIFIDTDGNYKIGDFGISRVVEHTTRASVGVGTYDYMSPEVINGNSYGLQADIYSLGMVLYYLMNERRHPFFPLPPAVPTYEEKQDARNRKWSGEPIPPSKNGCAEFKRIIMKACAFSPGNRYLTVQNMLDELNRIVLEDVNDGYAGKPSIAIVHPRNSFGDIYDGNLMYSNGDYSLEAVDEVPTQLSWGGKNNHPLNPPTTLPKQSPQISPIKPVTETLQISTTDSLQSNAGKEKNKNISKKALISGIFVVLCILISPLFNEDKREDSDTEAIVENNLSNSTEAKRGTIPKSEVSSDEITIRNGHNGTDIGKYRILYEPIRDCIGFTILIEATCENPDDNIDVCRAYVRELSGNWVEIGEIDVIGWSGVTDGPATGGCTFSFKDAISFDAYACLSGSSESNTDYTSGSRLSKLVYAQ